MEKNLSDRINSLPWDKINQELLENGFVIIESILSSAECEILCSQFHDDTLFRSTIDMKRYNFGKGSYRYFKYPLPEIIQTLRENLYKGIVSVANLVTGHLKLEITYPANFFQFKKLMEEKGQTKSTPLILHYQKDDYNCLHQDISNELIFPYQVVLGLSEQEKDYEGGHLVLTQQRPRMQSIPYIISVPKGGAVIFSSHFHPQKGAKGFYRTVFKHGVGKVTNGNRYTLGIVFHDYKE